MKLEVSIRSRIDDIKVDVFLPENWNEEKLILFCHGFNSGKNGASYVQIGKALNDAGVGYAIFSLPYHAERRLDPDDFSVRNCIEDIDLVEDKLREMFQKTKIGILGTSFSGYLTLLRLKQKKHNYFTIILKSPAIKMDEVFRSNFSDDDYLYFKDKGFVVLPDASKPMKIRYSFYKELEKNRVFDLGEYKENMTIYHGFEDEVVPYEDSKEFVSKNPNVTLVLLAGEGHSYSESGLKEFNMQICRLI